MGEKKASVYPSILDVLPWPIYTALMMSISIAMTPLVVAWAVAWWAMGRPLNLVGQWDCLATFGWLGKAWYSYVAVSFFAPYTGSIDGQLEEVSAGHCRAAITQRWRLQNPFTSIHAIAIANLGEFATGMAVLGRLEQLSGARAIPCDLNIKFFKKARGRITAVADLGPLPSTPGKHDVTCTANIFNEDGVKVSEFRALWTLSVSAPPTNGVHKKDL